MRVALLCLLVAGPLGMVVGQTTYNVGCACASIMKPTSNVGTTYCPTGGTCDYSLVVNEACSITCGPSSGFRTRPAYRIGTSWVSTDEILYVSCNATTGKYYTNKESPITNPFRATCAKFSPCDQCSNPPALTTACESGFVCNNAFLVSSSNQYECKQQTCSHGFLRVTNTSNSAVSTTDSIVCTTSSTWKTSTGVPINSATCRNYAACLTCTQPPALAAADAPSAIIRNRGSTAFRFNTDSFKCTTVDCPAGYSLRGASASTPSDAGLAHLNGMTGGALFCNNAGAWLADTGYTYPLDAKFLCVTNEETTSTTTTTTAVPTTTEMCLPDYDGCGYSIFGGFNSWFHPHCDLGRRVLSCGNRALKINGTEVTKAVCIDNWHWAAVGCGFFHRFRGHVEIDCASD